MAIVKKKKFETLNRKLSSQEEKELTESIRQDGVEVPVTLMQGDVLVDGYNRYRIAEKLQVKCPVKIRHFPGEDEAELWAIRQQLARRNLSSKDFKLHLGRLYNAEKNTHGGDRENQQKASKTAGKGASGQNVHLIPEGSESSGQNVHLKASEKIADEHNVSEKTVRRASKIVLAYDDLAAGAQKLYDAGKLTDPQMIAISKKTKSEQTKLATEIRKGQRDAATLTKSKPKPGQAKTTSAEMVDAITRTLISPLSKKIHQLAKLNGGEGPVYKEVREHMNGVIQGLKKMRKGER